MFSSLIFEIINVVLFINIILVGECGVGKLLLVNIFVMVFDGGEIIKIICNLGFSNININIGFGSFILMVMLFIIIILFVYVFFLWFILIFLN